MSPIPGSVARSGAAWRRGLRLATAVVALAGCARAPFGPAAGSTTSPTPIEGPRQILPMKYDNPRALIHWFRSDYGTLLRPSTAETVHVALYGDNRPGPRLATTAWGLGAIMDSDSRDPVSWLWATLNVPVLLVQAVIPRLDGARDLISSKWSRVYDGGAEQLVKSALVREPAHLIVNTGDVVENGRRGLHWDRFRARHAEILDNIPFVVAPGNHERVDQPEARRSFNHVLGVPEGTDRYWFTLDLPESLGRFVILDSNVLADPKDRYPDSLETALAEAQIWYADSSLAETPEGVVRFLVIHHPLVSAGQHASDWRNDRPGPKGKTRRERLLDICIRRGVTAVFTGHEHLYQRIYIEGPEGGGFWQVTSGGGGSPLHRIGRAEAREARSTPLPAGFRVHWNRPLSAHHYCRLTFPLETRRAMLDVMRVLPTGQVAPIERFDLAGKR